MYCSRYRWYLIDAERAPPLARLATIHIDGVNMYDQKKSRNTTEVAPLPSTPSAIDRDQFSDVKFLGWQRADNTLFPLYNISKIGHPSYLSTVTEKTLMELGLRIPRTPSPYPDVPLSPWHSNGTALNNVATGREVIEAAGLNFTVIKKPANDVLSPDHPAKASDRWITVRTDTGDVLGTVGDSYAPIQNKDAFTFFDSLIKANKAVYDTAGLLGHGERVWILAKLPGHMNVHGADLVSKYLLLSNSHDGSSLLRVKLTPIRVVCNNTLSAALKGTGEINIRHTGNAAEDMKQALALLRMSTLQFEQLDAVFNRMALTKITEKQLLEYLSAIVPDHGTDDDKKTKEFQDTCLDLYESGQGADLARGTLWGAVNCVTEYTDHKITLDSNARLESTWFGNGEQLKLRAFQLAEHMM